MSNAINLPDSVLREDFDKATNHIQEHLHMREAHRAALDVNVSALEHDGGGGRGGGQGLGGGDTEPYCRLQVQYSRFSEITLAL